MISKLFKTIIEKHIREYINNRFGFCNKCGSIIEKIDAQKVEYNGSWHGSVYYCREHKVPYDKVYRVYGNNGKNDTYYKNKVEVDEKGIMVK